MIQLKLTKKRSDVPVDNLTRDAVAEALGIFEDRYRQVPNRLMVDRRTAKQFLKWSRHEIGSTATEDFFKSGLEACLDSDTAGRARIFGINITISIPKADESYCYFAYDTLLAKKQKKVNDLNALILRDIMQGAEGLWVGSDDLEKVRIRGMDGRAEVLKVWDNGLGVVRNFVKSMIACDINLTPRRTMARIRALREAYNCSAFMMPCKLSPDESQVFAYFFADRL